MIRKRHNKIISKYSTQSFKSVINDIEFVAKQNISKKSIIICSTAQKVKLLQEKLDTFLDVNKNVKGNLIIVIGNQERELKYA